MHFTRRRLDRSSTAALVLISCAAAGIATASCSSNGDDEEGLEPDAALEGSASSDGDAQLSKDAPSPDDAGAFDAAPRTVVCASSSCATALVTTLLDDDYAANRAEGFCALLQDGTVACWGANQAGQLGRGEEAGAASSSTPARVVGLSNIVTLDHTCAIDKDGATWCWGTGPFLRNDAVATSTERAPVKLPIARARKIGMGLSAACALVEDGVVCWGLNSFAQIAPFKSAAPNAVLAPQRIPLPAGSPIRDLVVGEASFALREDGTVTSWGANPGLGRVSSLFPDPNPLPIALHGVSTMDSISANACAAAGGSGYCWGDLLMRAPDGLNFPSDLERALPMPVITPEPIVQIATTGQTGGAVIQVPQRWCASAASGVAYCWGRNGAGQAGDGTDRFAENPVKVTGLPEPVVQVRTTPDATCALLTTGKVYCWGSNIDGQLGNGKGKQPSYVPQEVVLP